METPYRRGVSGASDANPSGDERSRLRSQLTTLAIVVLTMLAAGWLLLGRV
jgi:hypothetical protein